MVDFFIHALPLAGPYDISVILSPLGTYWVFELGWTGLKLGLGGFGTKCLGTGLDNFQYRCSNLRGL